MIENDQKRSFGDPEIKRLSGGLRKKLGGAKRSAWTAPEDYCNEKFNQLCHNIFCQNPNTATIQAQHDLNSKSGR